LAAALSRVVSYRFVRWLSRLGNYHRNFSLSFGFLVSACLTFLLWILILYHTPKFFRLSHFSLLTSPLNSPYSGPELGFFWLVGFFFVIHVFPDPGRAHRSITLSLPIDCGFQRAGTFQTFQFPSPSTQVLQKHRNQDWPIFCRNQRFPSSNTHFSRKGHSFRDASKPPVSAFFSFGYFLNPVLTMLKFIFDFDIWLQLIISPLIRFKHRYFSFTNRFHPKMPVMMKFQHFVLSFLFFPIFWCLSVFFLFYLSWIKNILF